jgi:hypothetical protein
MSTLRTDTLQTTDSSVTVQIADIPKASDYAAGTGSTLIGWIRSAVGAVTRTVSNKLAETVSVKDFGAVGDGVTDDSAAVRLALDSLPSRGGVVVFPDAGPYYIPSVVYIPQRTTAFSSPGIKIRGNNTTIIGSGLGGNTIFESGTGAFSTVALGGATNFGQAPESVASIHYNSSIEGFNFTNCGTAVKLFNWIQGCTLKRLYATNCTTAVYAERSFYLGLHDVYGRPLDAARAATTPIFHFHDSNNTITFNNVHCSGIDGSNVNHGVGFKFTGGVQAMNLTNASAEGCVKGVEISSFVYDMNIDSFYFEKNDTHLDLSAATILHLTVNNNWFDTGTVAISANAWAEGTLGNGNYFSPTAGTVTFGAGATCTVYLPAKSLTDLTHTSWTGAPVGWTINAGCDVKRNDMIFNSAVGFNAVLFRNNPNSGGNTGIVPMSFTGDCFNVGGLIPYCAVINSAGTLFIDTKIAWNPNLSAVRFDLVVVHTQTDVIAGTLSGNNVIFRDDAIPARTVVATDNGGFVRLTVAGFGTITSFSGKVRII